MSCSQDVSAIQKRASAELVPSVEQSHLHPTANTQNMNRRLISTKAVELIRDASDTYDERPRVFDGVLAADDARSVVVERQHLLGADAAGELGASAAGFRRQGRLGGGRRGSLSGSDSSGWGGRSGRSLGSTTSSSSSSSGGGGGRGGGGWFGSPRWKSGYRRSG